ncbi:MAG: hypothetical protein RG741_08905 [Bacteroidales bacterium]|nr:hypothetical protein [Bacteroidales bacterium]
MKTLKIAIILSLLFPAIASAQTLLDIYKSGKVHLVPDPSYGQHVDWDTVFESYNDTLYGRWRGNDKSLTVLPDGSVVVSHTYRDFYTRFDANGSYVEEFGVKKPDGGHYRSLRHVQGVLKNNVLFSGLDNMGTMLCFDLSGNLVKTLHMDYMARQIIALPNNKLALVGWVLWSDRVREFVAIIDYETNEEKIIWDHFEPRRFGAGTHRFNYTYSFKEGGMISFTTMPFSKALGLTQPPQIASVGNKLVVTIPSTGEIRMYDLDGSFVSSLEIGWSKGYISVEEQREIQEKAISRYRSMSNPVFASFASEAENIAARDYFIREMEKDLRSIKDPIPMPYFANLIRDYDGNLLFFEFPKEEGANAFNVWVYKNGGEFVARSSFTTEGYNLEIKPSKMVFHNGYLYALVTKENASGIPLRLVRFKMESHR